MSAANGSHPTCSQPGCTRPETIRFHTLGGDTVPACARCAGSVIYRIVGDYGALVEVIGRDSFENRRRRERQLASRHAA